MLGEYGQSVVSCKDFSVVGIHHRTAVNCLVSQLVEEEHLGNILTLSVWPACPTYNPSDMMTITSTEAENIGLKCALYLFHSSVPI